MGYKVNSKLHGRLVQIDAGCRNVEVKNMNMDVQEGRTKRYTKA